MIYQIPSPDLPMKIASGWWFIPSQYGTTYVLIFIAIVLTISYLVCLVRCSARFDESSASFVSLACLDRLTSTHQQGSHILIHSGSDFPAVEQFEHVLPSDENSFRVTYRNELHVYSFRLKSRPAGGYDVFLVRTPSYDGRPADGASTFRADVGTARARIAFLPQMVPQDLPDAVRKAVFWAEANSRYIVTGQHWVETDRPKAKSCEPTTTQPRRPMLAGGWLSYTG